MRDRTFENRADWVGVIVEAATEELAKNPESVLYRQTNFNYSGGHEYWGDSASEVYRKPKDLEEGLLALELRSVLEKAAGNQFKIIDALAGKEPVQLSVTGMPMDFGLFISTAVKLAVRNPLTALDCKLHASYIAQKASGLPLTKFLTKYCLWDGSSGEEFCSHF